MLHKKMIIIFVLILFIVISGTVGFFAFRTFNTDTNANSDYFAFKDKDAKEVDNLNHDFISDKTTVFKEVNYTLGMPVTKQYTEKAGKDIIGMGKSDVIEYFKKSGFLVTDFSDKKLVVTKDINKWPPNYYVVKVEKDKIKIYLTDKDSNLIFKNYYDMSIDQLPEEDLNDLAKGKAFENLDQINSMFDEYKS